MPRQFLHDDGGIDVISRQIPFHSPQDHKFSISQFAPTDYTMRTRLLIYAGFLASLGCTAASSRSPSLALVKQYWPFRSNGGSGKAQTGQQAPTMNDVPGVQLPAGDGDNGRNDSEDPTGALTISDILPQTRSINIFAGLTRDISSVTSRLESQDPTQNTTLLAPLNSAMTALPRKPWEDRPGDTSGVSAARNEDKAAQNILRFVEAHVVPVSPWKEGTAGKIKTLGGDELWWEHRNDGKTRVVMPGNVEVERIIGKVGNGEIWAIRGVVNYS
jgi:hypothetical protein